MDSRTRTDQLAVPATAIPEGWSAPEVVKAMPASPLHRNNPGRVPPEQPEGPPPYSRVVTVNLADVEPRPVEWLWEGRIPIGKLTLLAGHPGLGKSFATLDLSARVSAGYDWPDGSPAGEPAGVVLLSAEDGLEDTVVPRLVAMSACLAHINAIETALEVPDPKTGTQKRSPFRLDRDLLALEEAIDKTADCRLVIVDPISSYLGAADSHKNAEVRGVLAPLATLAEKKGVAVVAVQHLNKSGGKTSRPVHERVLGSIGFYAAVRTAHFVTKDRDDRDRRLFLPAKNNLAKSPPGLAFRIEDDGSGPQVAWEPNPVDVELEDAVAESPRGSGKKNSERLLEACDFLRTELTNPETGQPKPAAAKQLSKDARDAGIAMATLRRAKEMLKVVSRKLRFEGDGTWVWELPDIETEELHTHWQDEKE